MKYQLQKPKRFDLSPPERPSSPTEPKTIKSERVFFQRSTKTTDSIPLLEALSNLPEDFPVEKLNISIKRTGNKFDSDSLHAVLIIEQKGEVENPAYLVATEKYENALRDFDEAMAIYKAAQKEYSARVRLCSKIAELRILDKVKAKTVDDKKKMKALDLSISKLCKELKIDQPVSNIKLV